MAGTSLVFDIFARDRASDTFQKIEQSSSQLGGRLSRFGAMAGTALAGATAALAGLATAGVITGLKTEASLQQASVAFETLLGSGEKAQAFLEDLKSFAAKTPFELPGLIGASRQLIGVGQSAESVIPTLQAWGDAAGALGVGQEEFERVMIAVTQAMSKGKVQAEELMQITENGIPIWPILSRAMGKPVAELQRLASEGKLLSKDVFPALEAQMNKDYGGAMAKQSQTLNGLWSTLMDTLNLGLADVIRPMVPALQQALPAATAKLWAALQALSSAVAAFGRVAGPVFSQTLTLARAFFNGLRGGSAGGAGAIANLTKAGGTLRQIFITLGPPIRGIGNALMGLARTVMPIIIQVAGTLGNAFKDALPDVVSAMQSIKSVIVSVTEIIRKAWAIAGPTILKIAKVNFGMTLKVISGVMKAIAGVVKAVTQLMNGNWKGALRSMFGAGKAIFGAIKALISGTIRSIAALLGINLGRIKSAFTNTFNSAKRTVSSAFSSIKSAASSGASAVFRFVRDNFNKAKTAASTALTALVKFVRGIPGKIKGAFGNVGNLLRGVGRNVVSGLIGGIRSKASEAVNAARKVVRDAISAAKGLLGIRSPSRVFAEIGRFTMEGFANGVTKNGREADRALVSTINRGVDMARRASAGLGAFDGAAVPSTAGVGLARRTDFAMTPGQAATLIGPRPMGAAGTSVNELHVHIHGPVGSQQELQNWLIKSLDDLRKRGRINSSVLRSA